MKLFFLLLFILPVFAGAQTTHKVQPKETLYSLARKYNVHPRELAEFNHIPVNTSLEIGQVIKIPSKTTMEPLPPANEAAQAPKQKVEEQKVHPNPAVVSKPDAKGKYPMYHKVEKKETLYRISKMYPNLTIEDIRKWNQLSGDGLSEGMNLIVGYSNNPSEVPHKLDIPEAEHPVQEPVAESPKPTPVPETKKAEPVKEPGTNTAEIPITPPSTPVKVEKGNNFKKIYFNQVDKRDAISEKGKAGVFKSTSGWEDGKYYCLSNTAPAGAIVKITNEGNNKVIYARVLDFIPDLKQNAGMILRLSNAGADELGITSDTFDCVISY